MLVSEVPLRIINGSGQSVTAGAAGSQTFTNAVGTQTQAIAVRLAPAATAYLATVRVSDAGTAATASIDYPIASTDQAQLIGVAPGQKVSIYFSAAGSAVMCELTR
jgi:hypothetical protein